MVNVLAEIIHWVISESDSYSKLLCEWSLYSYHRGGQGRAWLALALVAGALHEFLHLTHIDIGSRNLVLLDLGFGCDLEARAFRDYYIKI